MNGSVNGSVNDSVSRSLGEWKGMEGNGSKDLGKFAWHPDFPEAPVRRDAMRVAR